MLHLLKRTPLTLLCITITLLLAATATHGRTKDPASSSARAAQSQTIPGTTEKTLTIYGAKINYLEAGASTAPVVVLLHGLGGNTTNWAFNIAALARTHRVIVPDQIGFGRSDKPLINYRIATYVEFLDRMLQEMKIERATLVGNSMGGWIAATYALAHPAKVERLVLVDAAGFAPSPDLDLRTLSGLNPTTREEMRRLIKLVFYNQQLFGSDAFVDASMTQRISAGDGYTINQITESIKRNDEILDNRLAAIKHPTLIIWGRQDGLTPLALGERFNKEIPGSRLVVIDECGHVPQVEKAAEFNTALTGFLNNTLAVPAKSN